MSYLQRETRSYYRKESAAVTHRLENSQPIINIEIANNTLYVLVYFISKCLAYSTVITTLHCITVNGVYIYIYIYIYCTVLYSKKYLGFSSLSKCIYVYGILAPKSNVNSSYTLNHRGNVFISLPSFACI